MNFLSAVAIVLGSLLVSTAHAGAVFNQQGADGQGEYFDTAIYALNPPAGTDPTKACLTTEDDQSRTAVRLGDCSSDQSAFIYIDNVRNSGLSAIQHKSLLCIHANGGNVKQPSSLLIYGDQNGVCTVDQAHYRYDRETKIMYPISNPDFCWLINDNDGSLYIGPKSSSCGQFELRALGRKPGMECTGGDCAPGSSCVTYKGYDMLIRSIERRLCVSDSRIFASSLVSGVPRAAEGVKQPATGPTTARSQGPAAAVAPAANLNRPYALPGEKNTVGKVPSLNGYRCGATAKSLKLPEVCPDGFSCSQYDWCGFGPQYATVNCNALYGRCFTSERTPGRCGILFGNAPCPTGQYCSAFGHCSTDPTLAWNYRPATPASN